MRLFKKKDEDAAEDSIPGDVPAPQPRVGEPDAEPEIPADPAVTEAPEDDADEAETGADGPELIELEPADVELPLAFKLAAIDQAELNLANRDIASPGGKGLHDKLQIMRGVVWVVGPRKDPFGWTSIELIDDQPGVGIVRGTVHPKHRGEGLADELLVAPMLEKARELGLRSLVATVFAESPAEKFLLGKGWTETENEQWIVRRLELAKTIERRRRIVEDAGQFVGNYQVARVDKHADDEEHPAAPEGMHRIWVVAKIPVVGTEVGSTELTVYDDMPEFALFGDTYVEPEHRGHRLGLMMKAEAMRLVETERPKVRVVQSRTIVGDTYMLAIDDRLGARGAGIRRDIHTQL